MAFSGNVIKLVTGTAIAQGISVATIPIVTRFFGPDTFGVFGIFMSISAVLGSVACFRYEQAIMLPREEDCAVNLMAVSIAIACVMSLLITLFLWIGGDAIVNRFNIGSFENYIWLIPVMVFLFATYQVFTVWKSRTMSFGSVSIARVIQTMTSQSIAIGCGLFQLVAGGYLIVSRIAGQLFGVIFFIVSDYKNMYAMAQKVSLRKMYEGIKRYRDFPKYAAWSGMLISFSMELPIILMAIRFTPSAVGFFVLIRQMLRMPYTFIGIPIAQVFFQHASAIGVDRKELSKVIKDLYDRLLIISFFPLLALSIIGEDLFISVFGQKWGGAGQMAQIFCVAAFFEINLAPFGCLFNVMEEQKRGLIYDLNLMGCRFVFLMTGILIGDALLSVALFTVGDILGRLIKFQWIFKKNNFYVKDFIKLCVPLFRLSALLFVILLVQKLFQMDAVYYLISYCVCCLIYFIAVHIFHRSILELSRD